MITADKLRLLTNMPAVMLTKGIRVTGYKKDQFVKSEFLGITDNGEFCYKAEYIEDNNVHSTRVFVKYDSVNDRVTIDY